MHLMQHLSHHLRKQTPFSPHLQKAPAKESNPVITRNRRIAMSAEHISKFAALHR